MMLSHTPPVHVGSLEPPGFKRVRSSSISGRLRSASELFEDGVISSQQKGVLKDLIIAEDPKLNEVLQKIDNGDKSAVKDILNEGILDRKHSIDLLSDMGDTFDFLNVGSLDSNQHSSSTPKDSVFTMDTELDYDFQFQDDASNINLNNIKPISVTRDSVDQGSSGMSFGTPLPELFEFNLFDDQNASKGGTPTGIVRSSLSPSLLDDLDAMSENVKGLNKRGPKSKKKLGNKTSSANATSAPIGIPGTKSNRMLHAQSNLRLPNDILLKSSHKLSKAKGQSNAPANSTKPGAQTPHHGGRSETDKNGNSFDLFDTKSSNDSDKIGAYSPESRRKRIEKFLQKRQHRIWKKRVKYDVRKNFADSRLRVKGRFVKKEDEELLRDLMSMT